MDTIDLSHPEILSYWLLTRGGDLQVGLFFALLLGFGMLERWAPRRPGTLSRRERWPANLGLTAIAIAVLGIVPVSFIAAALWAESREIGLFHQLVLPGWLGVLATLLVRGFISTGTHWLNHRVPWFWRIHRVHHLDTDLDVSSTVRFHPLEMIVGPLIGVPVVIAFGLSPWVLALYELLDVSVTLFSHSNLHVPRGVDRWLRYLIVTPDLHRVHHSVLEAETNSNYGAVFPIWDLVLGTFRPEPSRPHEEMVLGLDELRGAEAHRVGELLLSPFRRRLRDAGGDAAQVA